MQRNYIRIVLLTAMALLTITVIVLLAKGSSEEIPEHVIQLEPSSEPIHIRVLFEQNPATEAQVSWTTTAEGDNHILYFDTEPRGGEASAYRFSSEDIHSGKYSLRPEEEGMDSWYHHAYMSNLEPNTSYYVMVETDESKSDEYYFITAPDDDRSVALLMGGDSRVGHSRIEEDNNRRKMNERMKQLFEEHPHILALAHTADYTNRAYWSELYWWLKDHYETTTASDNRLLPIIPSRGNHDLDVGFEEKFYWPNRENDFYYATQINSETVMIVLNTEISISGDQKDWLEQTLKEVRPNNRNVAVMFHKPLYPSVRAYDGSERRRRAWGPLLEEHGVDFVAVGHDHALKRTVPILNEKADPNGIVYIGDGGLGVSTREVVSDRWYLQSPGMTKSAYNVHFVEFNEDHIGITAFGMNGDVLDEFMIPADREERTSYYESILQAVSSR
ncbi:hypothetical protein DYD21_03800 [Rhodohalobacter sp. SW132]|uniref:metallophosphoesterase n=1 Tax=Rhodohalobacter sp. SW132 TaxID=2293433 RepID=UPI000E247FFB|nr:metallophosphoesterase [Rhodohalobacter sp. SW132]REL39091.1 hypothetical protein DYD21_03800 [Rhodohalobacter sp. SW132]